MDHHCLRFLHHSHERERSAGAVLIAAERIMITVLVMMVTGLLIVVTEIRVMLHPMRDGSGYMRPLMQIQYAEGVQGKGEGEEVTHGVKVGLQRGTMGSGFGACGRSNGYQAALGTRPTLMATYSCLNALTGPCLRQVDP